MVPSGLAQRPGFLAATAARRVLPPLRSNRNAPVWAAWRRNTSHDHIGDIFATLDAEAFQHCFVAWVARALNHMVLTCAARQRLAMGPVKVADRSNEIVDIPKPLDMLAIKPTLAMANAD